MRRRVLGRRSEPHFNFRNFTSCTRYTRSKDTVEGIGEDDESGKGWVGVGMVGGTPIHLYGPFERHCEMRSKRETDFVRRSSITNQLR